jgi:hypothetical protein
VYLLSVSSNTIGGSGTGAGNVISGNTLDGILVQDGADSNTIQGNRIGTNAAGTADLGNSGSGVRIFDASYNLVGGTAPGAGNLISGNEGIGVQIYQGTPTGNEIVGNLIGTDVTGMLGIGNGTHGILVGDAVDTVVGGSTPAARNVIAANGSNGVYIFTSTRTSVQGNLVGVAADGLSPLGNDHHGVAIANGSTDSTIGGEGVTGGRCDGPCNVIVFGQGVDADGVYVEDGANVSNAILGNCIHSNAHLGIDIGPDGMTANDDGDGDSGGNDLQNYPVLSLAQADAGGATVEGTLNSTPLRRFRVEFFANAGCDASAHGEGARYLGFTLPVTDASGNASFSTTVAAPVADGEAITATATNTSTRNTSEYSACITATCLESVTFGHTITALDKGTLGWAAPEDVRYVRGELASVSSYGVLETGDLPGATSLDISADSGAMYYLVKPLGCGSWQTTAGGEPQRDAQLP